ALQLKPDFITLDSRGGATGAAPTHIKDNICIPTPYSIYRAHKFLQENGGEDISLLVTGGFRSSADIVKALALGADAIGISTIAMIGIGCQQYRVCHKGTCPVGIATQDEKLRAVFDIDKSALMLTNLFKVYQEEIADFIRICGKKSISELDVSDLVTTDINISQYTAIKHA
ncbi:glutamate synthase-related protein, partial [Thiotrichales bacterium HSG1]|nr:glutamate synthase-related protein [Thiotrichales bacterium HSG1]